MHAWIAILSGRSFAVIVSASLLLCLSACNRRPPAEDAQPPAVQRSQLSPELSRGTRLIGGAAVRRSPESLLSLQSQDVALLEAAVAGTALSFSFSFQDGLVTVSAAGTSPPSHSAQKILNLLAFKPLADSAGVWVKILPLQGAAALAPSIASALQEAQATYAGAQALLRLAQQPGALVTQLDEQGRLMLRVPGKLLYTGQNLDFAFSDAGEDPRLFVELLGTDRPGPLFVRSGRIYFDEEGYPALGPHRLAGVWKRLPRDVEQVGLRSDGALVALRRDGSAEALGRLRAVQLPEFHSEDRVFFSAMGPLAAFELRDTDSPLRVAHLEFPGIDRAAEIQRIVDACALRRTLEALAQLLAQASLMPALPPLAPQAAEHSAIVFHAEMPWSAEHFRALGINLERVPGRLTIAAENDPGKVAAAAITVLQVLRQRLAIHEQNLRNAERVRDENNRLNPYRRKTLSIGGQGEAVEGVDPAPFRKLYKPGDANADAEGFIALPNVNKVMESADFGAAVEEYKLVRAALQKLAPLQIFPDPPALPADKP